MKIANFRAPGFPVLAVDDGDGYVNYGAILEARGIRLGITGTDTGHYPAFLLAVGLLDPEFIRTHLRWASESGKDFSLDAANLAYRLPMTPGKIVCVARNWEEHAKEGGHSLPEHPVIFVKTSNCVIGPGDAIPYPNGIERVDHEGELGIVIGRQMTKIKAAGAPAFIHSYTIVNDVTARSFQKRLAGNKWPWYAAKSMDGFAPTGPILVTPDEFEPIEAKRIKVTVNNETRQDGSIAGMHWKPPELLEYITQYITLYPGDLVATGTPPGVSPIKTGDQVAVEIDGIGRLVNTVN